MNRSIEQSLLSLLPTHNGALPPKLIELASSLLAQSRLRASTLKAEEDIARPYACSHLACDRLKITLDLPPIEPRPPIPPRIYKRLYTHLDKILPNTSSTPKARRIATPSSKRREQLGVEAPPLAARSTATTPSKTKTQTPLRNGTATPSKQRPSAPSTPVSKRKHTNRTDDLPPWVRPTIRFLVASLPGCARLGPTLAAGMDAMWSEPAPPRKRGSKVEQLPWARDNATAALAATAYYASQRLAGRDNVEKEVYAEMENEIVTAFGRVMEEVVVKGNGEEAWEGWSDLSVADFRLALLAFSDGEYTESDWFEGVDDLRGDDGECEEDGEAGAEGRVRRADSMMQEKYDFLGKKRQEEYRRWKLGIMKRIKAMERERADAMEVDS